MLVPLPLPSLFVIGAEAGAGSTFIAGAIANWFHRQRARAGVCIPVATGAARRREGLVSEEAEFLAVCADAAFPLDLICPERFAEPLLPAVAARRAGRAVDTDSIERSLRLIARGSDVLIATMPGGLIVPLDDRMLTIDLVAALRSPAIVVTRPGSAAINAAALSVEALRSRGLPVAGIVVNRYPSDTPSIDIETSLRELEKWAKAPLLCVVPDEPSRGGPLSGGVTGAIDLVDWWRFARPA